MAKAKRYTVTANDLGHGAGAQVCHEGAVIGYAIRQPNSAKSWVAWYLEASGDLARLGESPNQQLAVARVASVAKQRAAAAEAAADLLPEPQILQMPDRDAGPALDDSAA